MAPVTRWARGWVASMASGMASGMQPQEDEEEADLNRHGGGGGQMSSFPSQFWKVSECDLRTFPMCPVSHMRFT